eukprot:gnl/MRDRNA2_/MRDRNA2_86180_c0_seq5.p1 gnl/MRDRNA2_/MRDRNA2_86180_c0~~gnl/MRDRNA2_/MRDRNA2_86180_c0_seq5.p1  ORF type:complete len:913 (+),score=108.41 gnl/MRDRNA2_/MRDRNA2_86180_c0_seq5:118-2856(+)
MAVRLISSTGSGASKSMQGVAQWFALVVSICSFAESASVKYLYQTPQCPAEASTVSCSCGDGCGSWHISGNSCNCGCGDWTSATCLTPASKIETQFNYGAEAKCPVGFYVTGCSCGDGCGSWHTVGADTCHCSCGEWTRATCANLSGQVVYKSQMGSEIFCPTNSIATACSCGSGCGSWDIVGTDKCHCGCGEWTAALCHCNSGHYKSRESCLPYSCESSHCLQCKPQSERTAHNQCISCNPGYHLSGTTCTAYNCTTGPGGSCSACPAQGDRTSNDHCIKCNPGYHLSSTTCVAYTCTTGPGGSCNACHAQDDRKADNHCSACNLDYTLSGTGCLSTSTPITTTSTINAIRMQLSSSTPLPPCSATDKVESSTPFTPSECQCSSSSSSSTTAPKTGPSRAISGVESPSSSTSAPTTGPSRTQSLQDWLRDHQNDQESKCPKTVKECWLDDISMHSGPTTGSTKVELSFKSKPSHMIPRECRFAEQWAEVQKDKLSGKYFCLTPAGKISDSGNVQVFLDSGDLCFQERNISFHWYENPQIVSVTDDWCWIANAADPLGSENQKKIRIQLDKSSPQLDAKEPLHFGDSKVKVLRWIDNQVLEATCPVRHEKGKVSLRFCPNDDCQHQDVNAIDFHYFSQEEARNWMDWCFQRLWGIVATVVLILNWCIGRCMGRRQLKLFQDRAEFQHMNDLPPLPPPSYLDTVWACCYKSPQNNVNVNGKRPLDVKYKVNKLNLEVLSAITKAILRNGIAYVRFSAFQSQSYSLHRIFAKENETAMQYLKRTYSVFLHERNEEVRIDVVATADAMLFQGFLEELYHLCETHQDHKACFYLASREALNEWINALRRWPVEDQIRSLGTGHGPALNRAMPYLYPEDTEQELRARSSSCPAPLPPPSPPTPLTLGEETDVIETQV